MLSVIWLHCLARWTFPSGCVALDCSEIFLEVTCIHLLLGCIVSRTVHTRVKFKIMHSCWKEGRSVKKLVQASWMVDTVVDRSSNLLIIASWEGILYLQWVMIHPIKFFFKNWYRSWQLNLFKMKLILSIELIKPDTLNIFIFTSYTPGNCCEKKSKNS